MLTDFVFGAPDRVRHSLSIVCASSAALAAWMAWQARSHYQRLATDAAAEEK
jgi:hypothetical protein